MALQSTFNFLQVVNPPVYAELMQAKLDPASPGEPASMRCLAVLPSSLPVRRGWFAGRTAGAALDSLSLPFAVR